ncbi:MAG: hypothetical protein SGJ21_02565, partial [Alphaproteobacteria bacterium]|nr:hypothetical protein [Alphaproteobacteria bacterium]
MKIVINGEMVLTPTLQVTNNVFGVNTAADQCRRHSICPVFVALDLSGLARRDRNAVGDQDGE